MNGNGVARAFDCETRLNDVFRKPFGTALVSIIGVYQHHRYPSGLPSRLRHQYRTLNQTAER